MSLNELEGEIHQLSPDREVVELHNVISGTLVNKLVFLHEFDWLYFQHFFMSSSAGFRILMAPSRRAPEGLENEPESGPL